MLVPGAYAPPSGLAVTTGLVTSGPVEYVWVTTAEELLALSTAKYFRVSGPLNVSGVAYLLLAVVGVLPSVV